MDDNNILTTGTSPYFRSGLSAGSHEIRVRPLADINVDGTIYCTARRQFLIYSFTVDAGFGI